MFTEALVQIVVLTLTALCALFIIGGMLIFLALETVEIAKRINAGRRHGRR
jgi:hypothetical protein